MAQAAKDVRPAASRWPPRRADMTHLLDTVLICAILTILIVRTELYLTNYPQIGGNGLHIAHLLWGGLLMVISLGILLAFVIPAARQFAAVLGGIGFGLFMDEVGKFVTSDNNYFFKPTAAIIYCVFIVAFVVVRQLDRGRMFTRREFLLNTIESTKDIPMFRMDEESRAHALSMLDKADQSDPMVPHLRHMLSDPRCLHPRRLGPIGRMNRRGREWLRAAVDLPGFQEVVIAAVIVWMLSLVVQLLGVTYLTDLTVPHQQVLKYGTRISNVPFDRDQRDFVWQAIAVSTVAAIGFAGAGLVRLVRGNRRGAFVLFERGLLVAIFFLQVFAFAHSQFSAVFGLLVDLGLFVAVRVVLLQEYERKLSDEGLAASDEARG